MKKVLIIDDLHPSIKEMLSAIQLDNYYHPTITRKEILELNDDYVGMLVRSKTYLDKEILDNFPSLKFIGRAGAGVDLIDLEEVEKRNISLINAPEGNRDALAEHALAILLSVMNNTVRGHQEIEQYIWQREANRGYELGNLTIGLVGYGFMGKAFAQRLKAMGCKILAYDKYKTGFSDEFVTESNMDDIFANADVFTIHVPLEKDTEFMLDDAFFNSFKKPIWFTNTARGKVLKTESLYNAILNGKVKGAALDVLENEKPKNWSPDFKELVSNLFKTGIFHLTPHVGGWTHESYQKINDVLIEKIKTLDIKG